MAARDELEKHAKELSNSTGLKAEIIDQGNRLFVVLSKVTLQAGSARVTSTDVLFIADTQYPLSAMDMFWTEVDVVRPDGTSFEGSDTFEEYLGRKWRRFSYHRNGVWNPGGNPLMDHFAFMETRWSGQARR